MEMSGSTSVISNFEPANKCITMTITYEVFKTAHGTEFPRTSFVTAQTYLACKIILIYMYVAKENIFRKMQIFTCHYHGIRGHIS
jgi:hypothetical protein